MNSRSVKRNFMRKVWATYLTTRVTAVIVVVVCSKAGRDFAGAKFFMWLRKDLSEREKRSQMFNKQICISLWHVSINIFLFLSSFSAGLMICRNAKHLSETMVFYKHRIKSISDPPNYIQYFNALEYLDGKGVVIEIQFSWWSFDDF